MASYMNRPLPAPPDTTLRDKMDRNYMGIQVAGSSLTTGYLPLLDPRSYSYGQQKLTAIEVPPSTLPSGTLLHKGFYDLLALLPSTPVPSRFFWGYGERTEPVAGPSYDKLANPQQNAAKSPTPPVSPKNLRGRRVSKDMVSKPTNFM